MVIKKYNNKQFNLFYRLSLYLIRKNTFTYDYNLKLNSRKNLLFFTSDFNSYDYYDKNNYILEHSYNFFQLSSENKILRFGTRKKIYSHLLQLYYSKIYFFIIFKKVFFFFNEIFRYTFSLFFLLKKKQNKILFINSFKDVQKRKILYFSFLKNAIYKLPIYHLYFSFDFLINLFDYYRTRKFNWVKELSFYFKIIFFYKFIFFQKLLFLKR